MSAQVIPMPRRPLSPCQEVVGQVATTREQFVRLLENRIFHELDRQTSAVIELGGVLRSSDVLASLLFHYDLAVARLEKVGTR